MFFLFCGGGGGGFGSLHLSRAFCWFFLCGGVDSWEIAQSFVCLSVCCLLLLLLLLLLFPHPSIHPSIPSHQTQLISCQYPTGLRSQTRRPLLPPHLLHLQQRHHQRRHRPRRQHQPRRQSGKQVPRGPGGYGLHLVRVRGVCGECGVECAGLEEGGEVRR